MENASQDDIQNEKGDPLNLLRGLVLTPAADAQPFTQYGLIRNEFFEIDMLKFFKKNNKTIVFKKNRIIFKNYKILE